MSHKKLHAVIALLVGAGISAAAYQIQTALAGAALLKPGTILGDALLGAIIAVSLYLLFGHVERRRELLRWQLYAAVSADLNHHIRNALQLILNQAEMMEGQRSSDFQQIREAVDRIDWALREVLPQACGSSTQRLRIPSRSAEHHRRLVLCELTAEVGRMADRLPDERLDLSENKQRASQQPDGGERRGPSFAGNAKKVS